MPRSLSLSFNFFFSLKSQICTIWITLLTLWQHFRSKDPFTVSEHQKRNTYFIVTTRFSGSAIKMARIPFTLFSLILISTLSIPNLAHCKTLKRDGNVNTYPCRFLSFFIRFRLWGCRFMSFHVMGPRNIWFFCLIFCNFCSESFERDQGLFRLESGVCLGWWWPVWRWRSASLVWCHLFHYWWLSCCHRAVSIISYIFSVLFLF